ncbi:hypothetical protein PAMP_013379 [Pampus punctatissimus]
MEKEIPEGDVQPQLEGEGARKSNGQERASPRLLRQRDREVWFIFSINNINSNSISNHKNWNRSEKAKEGLKQDKCVGRQAQRLLVQPECFISASLAAIRPVDGPKES